METLFGRDVTKNQKISLIKGLFLTKIVFTFKPETKKRKHLKHQFQITLTLFYRNLNAGNINCKRLTNNIYYNCKRSINIKNLFNDFET